MFSEGLESNSFETIVDFVSSKLDYCNVLFGPFTFFSGGEKEVLFLGCQCSSCASFGTNHCHLELLQN